jgi:RIO-like serine/threonine protein kinase
LLRARNVDTLNVEAQWVSKEALLKGTRVRTEILTNILDTYIDLGLVERRNVSTGSKPRSEFRLVMEGGDSQTVTGSTFNDSTNR